MAMVLTRFPRDPLGRTFQVCLATRPSEIEAAQRLRRQIYVDELGIVPPDHAYVVQDRLVDPYDAWSSHLLLRCDGRDVGTVRVTEAADGPLELDESTDVRPHLPAGARPGELTRFMVLREVRRSQAAPLLLYGAFRVLVAGGSTHLVAAARVGSLGQYYRRAGLRLLGAEPFTYALTGTEYELGAIDLGLPGSLRRAVIQGVYGGLKWAGGYATPVVHLVCRRRLSARRDAHPAPVQPSPPTPTLDPVSTS